MFLWCRSLSVTAGSRLSGSIGSADTTIFARHSAYRTAQRFICLNVSGNARKPGTYMPVKSSTRYNELECCKPFPHISSLHVEMLDNMLDNETRQNNCR